MRRAILEPPHQNRKTATKERICGDVVRRLNRLTADKYQNLYLNLREKRLPLPKYGIWKEGDLPNSQPARTFWIRSPRGHLSRECRGRRARACSHYPIGWRCAGKLPQTRRRTKALVIPRRGRQQRMRRFSPQPEGPGPIFPISVSVVASRHPVSTPQTKKRPQGPRYASLLPS